MMTGIEGQASAEYAGLLALAAIIGATLALIVAPPLVHSLREALAAVLSGSARQTSSAEVSAADIADVQAAVSGAEHALTPDAALLALSQRHGRERAAEISDALVLEAALDAAPWMREPRVYSAWKTYSDGPYKRDNSTSHGDRDVESPTASPALAWITTADQRRVLESRFAPHVNAFGLILDALPGGRALKIFLPARRLRIASRLPRAAGDAVTGTEVVDVFAADSEGIPPGTRAGDVIVSWPAHRAFWRDGQQDASALIDFGNGLGHQPTPRDYRHIVYFRPGPTGLTVIGEAIRA